MVGPFGFELLVLHLCALGLWAPCIWALLLSAFVSGPFGSGWLSSGAFSLYSLSWHVLNTTLVASCCLIVTMALCDGSLLLWHVLVGSYLVAVSCASWVNMKCMKRWLRMSCDFLPNLSYVKLHACCTPWHSLFVTVMLDGTPCIHRSAWLLMYSHLCFGPLSSWLWIG